MEKKPEELIRGGDNFALLYREPAQRFENMVRKANSVCVEDAAVPLQKTTCHHPHSNKYIGCDVMTSSA